MESFTYSLIMPVWRQRNVKIFLMQQKKVLTMLSPLIKRTLFPYAKGMQTG